MSRIPFHNMNLYIFHKSFKLQILIPLKARLPVNSDVKSFLMFTKKPSIMWNRKSRKFFFFYTQKYGKCETLIVPWEVNLFIQERKFVT